MEFRIADTFQDSLARLTGDEQKVVKTTAFDLQMNPATPSMQFHKLDRAKDKRFWSVRAGGDIRIIVHRSDQSFMLCYVDHHDDAYKWAERRKMETHPKTGAAQMVEIRERVQEVVVPVFVEEHQPAPSKPCVFAHLSDDELLGYGVPPEWLPDVRKVTEDTYLDVVDHLPAEATEALWTIVMGGKPEPVKPAEPDTEPFDHPDAQRRFRLMNDVEELERALEFPWDKWRIFLHPAQRQWVERDYNGPARVSGSAGTGKTIVALHRAVHLARTNPDVRVLLTTFSEILANALRSRLNRLIHNEPRLAERLEVLAIDTVGQRLYKSHFGPPQVATRAQLETFVREASEEVGGHRFSLSFLVSEWEQVVDAWQLDSWEAYRDVRRLGRKTRLPEAQRAALWSIFEKVRTRLTEVNLITKAGVFNALAAVLDDSKAAPFDHMVVDESQDISIQQLRFLATLAGGKPNGLFFAGDLGQRIFQQPFSWKSVGVDIRGRARTLRVNYRTSHQIRLQSDRLLAPEMSDVDENVEERTGMVSVFNGPSPAIQVLDSEEEEIVIVSQWIKCLVEDGVASHEFGVFVRSEAQLDRAIAAVRGAGLHYKAMDNRVETASGHVALGTMHLAKGLEFRAVVVMACDDEVIPLQERIETIVDDSDLEEVYNTERHLLYVACTRARDHLLVTGVAPASEFLDDLKVNR